MNSANNTYPGISSFCGRNTRFSPLPPDNPVDSYRKLGHAESPEKQKDCIANKYRLGQALSILTKHWLSGLEYGNMNKVAFSGVYATKESTKRFYFAVLCVTIGIVVRILYLLTYPEQVRDAFSYKEYIDLWITSGKFPCTTAIPPLGIYLLKMPHVFFGNNIFAGGIVLNMILGLCIICLFMRLSLCLCRSYTLERCIGIITATHPTLVHYSCQMLRENSFIFFCCLGLISFLSFVKKEKKWSMLSTAFFAATACMCRYEAWELFVIIIVFILFRKKKKHTVRNGTLLISFVLCFLLSFVIISYIIDVPPDYYYAAIKDEILTKTTTLDDLQQD